MRLRSCEKAMGSCPAQFKMLLFCVKTVVKESGSFELATPSEEKNKKIKEGEGGGGLRHKGISYTLTIFKHFAALA